LEKIFKKTAVELTVKNKKKDGPKGQEKTVSKKDGGQFGLLIQPSISSKDKGVGNISHKYLEGKAGNPKLRLIHGGKKS